MENVTKDDIKTLIATIRELALDCAGEYGHGNEHDPDPSVGWALGFKGIEFDTFNRIVALMVEDKP